MKNISVQIKVVAGIIIVLAVSVGFSLFISLDNQRNNLLDSSRRNLVTNNDMLNTQVRNMMLDGEAPLVVSTLSDLKQLPGFSELEIYRRDGTIAFSDFATLNTVNANQNEYTFEQTPRQELKTIDNQYFASVLRSNTPKQVEKLDQHLMEYYFPILNYKQCRSCHGTDHFVRGVAFYQISLDRIFDQIGQARNSLITFFLVAGALIALVLILLVRRIIIKPLFAIGSVVDAVGGGNLEIRSDIHSSDELGNLSDKINSMITGLKEKNRLEVQNRVIEARNAENRKYLDNINEGLLLINPDYSISEQYSNFVKELFGAENVAGVPFVDFIFPRKEQHQDDRRELEYFLKVLFEKISTDMEMIMSINPLTDKPLTVEKAGGTKEIIINTDFQRIYGNNGVENVMAIFEDKTEIVKVQRELEREKERSETELEQIQVILKLGPQSFIEFAEDAADTLGRIESDFEGKVDDNTINKIMRELHSLKGTARYLEFRHVAELCHSAENLLSEIREEKRSWDSGVQEELEQKLEDIRNELQNIDKINDTFKSFAQELSSEERTKAEMRNFLSHIKRMTEGIAEELGKQVEVTVSSDIEELPHLSALRNPIIHIARNAIDHGIEDEIERVSQGKSGTARIRFRFIRKDGHYRIIISDDGRGIDFEAVRKKASEKGMLTKIPSHYTDEEMLRFLFKPDFSTKNNVSEISGRGAGLDVVRDEIRKLGGHISVYTKKNEGTRFTITLPKEEKQA